MRQYTYQISKDVTLTDVLQKIASEEAYQKAKTRLLMILEPEPDEELIRQELSACKTILPAAKVFGMTTLGPLSAKTKTQTDLVISLMLFDKSDVLVLGANCTDQNQRSLGREFRKKLSQWKDLKGMLCMSSGVQLCPAPFIEEIRRGTNDVPVFGAQAGSKDLMVDMSKIFIGEDIIRSGILVVAFYGESLEIKTDYNMGWIPLGHEFQITESDSNGVVSKIDDQDALQIYEQFLDVTPDEFFYENVCSFPLLMTSAKRNVAKVPLRYTEDGKLQFSMELKRGTRVSLSYSKPEYLLKESLASANGMVRFQPGALLLFACMNRRLFMGNEKADREFDYYRHAKKDLCWSYGNGEILLTDDGGGVLNSSLIAVGFREEEPAKDFCPESFADESLVKKHSNIPLSNRLVTFLEATSRELHESINQLESLAEHDQLTGIYNRRRLDEIVRYEVKKRRREDELAVLLFDVDHFKAVNDGFGHDMGDIVLKKVSEVVSSTIRSCDVFGRWGGDEFVCILTNTPKNGAEILAERIRANVEKIDFGRVGKVTVSIGIASALQRDTAESLLIRADRALYDGKNGGRNRVASKQ